MEGESVKTTNSGKKTKNLKDLDDEKKKVICKVCFKANHMTL